MKKFIFVLLFLGQCFALSDKEIISFYEPLIKTQFPKAKLLVGKRQGLENGFESVELVIKNEGQESSELIFIKDGFIFPDIIDVKNKRSLREEYEFKKFESLMADFKKRAQNSLKNEKQLISLGDANKPKIYVFSDPMCPHCQAHLARISEELKQYQVNFVLVGIFGEPSFNKIAQINTEIKNAKTDEQKLAILKKYYDKNTKIPQADKKAYEEAVALSEKYAKLGLRSVPTFVELK